jgi:alpha-galactosidase
MYGIWERVRARYPNLILENCSGGGGRTDLGMASQYHYTWFSDYVLAPRGIRMQNGMMMAIAPDRLARLTGIVMNGHLSTGDLDLQMRMNILLGSPGLSGLWPTAGDANPIAERQIKKALDFYKQHIRPMIASCKVFLHTPELPGRDPEGWCVIEYATPDTAKAIVGVFRLAGQGEQERTVKLRGVSRHKQYQVWFDNAEEWVVAPGRDLIEQGITIRLPQAMSSELLMATERKE